MSEYLDYLGNHCTYTLTCHTMQNGSDFLLSCFTVMFYCHVLLSCFTVMFYCHVLLSCFTVMFYRNEFKRAWCNTYVFNVSQLHKTIFVTYINIPLKDIE